MTDQSTDTKVKIMNAARMLFADHGFEGTSIRDIAKAAEVNVASVNYHFTNKENLLGEILRSGYLECSAEVENLYNQNNGNLEDTLVGVFHYFLNNTHILLPHFKMMMSAQHVHHTMSVGTEDGSYGPPGGMVIAKAILKEVGHPVEEFDLHWGLKTLFSHVTHISIIQNCCVKGNPENAIPFSSIEDFEKGIRRLTKLVLKDLKA